MKEIWKDIPGYEGKYQASSLGNIKSMNYNHTGKEKIMLGTPDKNGYFRVVIGGKTIAKHILIAITFIQYTGLNPDGTPIKGKPQVNHKDEIKTNNSVDNLEWCDIKYNSNYGSRNKRLSNVQKGISREYTYKKVRCIETGIVYDSPIKASEQLGISRLHIGHAANPKDRHKTAGGYHWEYLS